MPKRVIFHIGLPKTGTTSVQHYMRGQYIKLRSVGFIYPGIKEHPRMDSHKHQLILRGLLGKSQPSEDMTGQSVREAIERVFAEFRGSNFENLVWSNEGIVAHAFDLDGDYVRKLLYDFDVRVVLFARYVDDWVESLYKERIRGRVSGNAEKRKPMLLPAPRRSLKATSTRHVKSALELGSEIAGSVRAIWEILQSAEIVVRSFDTDREAGAVVSGALAAIGLPENAFPDADDDASVHNPSKSNLYSMFLFHLLMGQADAGVIRAVNSALRSRDRQGLQYVPLCGRRFRFLSEENIVTARRYYEELRDEYPHLPAQPPYAPDPAERSLPRDEGVALLDWLRPDISDAIFDSACAAYSRS